MSRGELYGISLRSTSPNRGLPPSPKKVTISLVAVSETATQKPGPSPTEM